MSFRQWIVALMFAPMAVTLAATGVAALLGCDNGHCRFFQSLWPTLEGLIPIALLCIVTFPAGLLLLVLSLFVSSAKKPPPVPPPAADRTP